MLLHPIPKQPWELTYDKVTLINKIGAGAFGEVWRGCIHESPSSPPIDVAVKMVSREFFRYTTFNGDVWQ